jgi:hypothetical protein
MTITAPPPPTINKPATFSALVPFAGFYGSWHDAHIDDAEESLFQDDSGNILSQRLYQEFTSNLNYGSVFESYAEAYVACLSKAIGVSLTFEEMVSPREYNFQTDRLFATLSRSDLARILRAVRGKRLNQKAAEWFTSCSGFISRYPNYIPDWPPIRDWDHNHVGCALACYVDSLREEEVLLSEEDFIQAWIGMSHIKGWLHTAAHIDERARDTAGRALKLNDYLRRRQERNRHVGPTQQ